MVRILPRLMLLIFLLSASAVAQAATFSQACIVHQTTPTGPDSCASNPDDFDSAVNGSVTTADFTVGGVEGHATAQATGPLGLRASAKASVTGGFGGVVSAEARAVYSDTITLTGTGVAPGTAGKIDFLFDISGLVKYFGSGTGSGGSNIQLIVNWSVPPQPGASSDFWQVFKLGPADISVNETFVTKKFDVVYGVAVPIEFIFSATSVLATVTGDVTANANFASTVILTDVRGFDDLEDQVAIGLTSDAGIEYPISMAVPEPGTAVLLAFGLCGLASVSARARRTGAGRIAA